MSIHSNLQSISYELPKGCKLIAVSKYATIEQIQEAYNAGQRAFGESRVQDLIEKASTLPSDIEWHLIGHLQKNKVRKAIEIASYIHSIDSLELLERIFRIAAEIGQSPRLLLQIKLRPDDNKSGLTIDELISAMPRIKALSESISIIGLMTILPLSTKDPEALYTELRDLKDKLNKEYSLSLTELSMGMSGDYKKAITSGATMIRVGSKIFK